VRHPPSTIEAWRRAARSAMILRTLQCSVLIITTLVVIYSSEQTLVSLLRARYNIRLYSLPAYPEPPLTEESSSALVVAWRLFPSFLLQHSTLCIDYRTARNASRRPRTQCPAVNIAPLSCGRRATVSASNDGWWRARGFQIRRTGCSQPGSPSFFSTRPAVS
jgi:hypothetical protein